MALANFKFKHLFTLLSFGLSLIILAFCLYPQPSPISPLSPNPPHPSTTKPGPRQVIGFIPYWNLSKISIAHTQPLTDIMYFALEPGPDGSLVMQPNAQDSGQGWRWYTGPTLKNLIRQTHPHLRWHLVIKLFDSDILTLLCTDPTARQNFISSLGSAIALHPLSGINLDYEPASSLDPQVLPGCTRFFHQVKHELSQTDPQLIYSIDLIGKSADGKYPADPASWAPIFDYFIIMAYDYHHAGSSIAGPISPLYQTSPYSQSILKNLSQLTSVIPPSKLVLGIPLYGYRWQTVDGSYKSRTFPQTGATVIQNDLHRLLSDSPQLAWSQESLTPWFTQTTNDTYFQTHYEDRRSLTYKLDLVDHSGLQGIALWAIGYADPSLDIWQPIIKWKQP